MSIHKDDRILWFIVGVGLFFAYRGILEQLEHVRKLTEITNEDGPGKKLDQETEDAVKIETLTTLTKGHNRELRHAATRIVCDRFVRGPAIERLYGDLAGRDLARRDQALTTTLFLLKSSALNESNISKVFYEFKFLRALKCCLVNLLPEHHRPQALPKDDTLRPSAKVTSSPIRPPNRPLAETQALQILCKVLPVAPNTALLSGLVSEWLANYPFPCALPENGSQRGLVLKYFEHWHQDDLYMSHILGFIKTFRDGHNALNKAGFSADDDYLNDDTEDEYGDDISWGDFDGDTVMHGAEDTAGPVIVESGRRRVRRRRAHVDSAEEQAMRRRRREAMVISDGTRPLDQDNIILRNDEVHLPPTLSQSDTDEQLSRLQEEVDREFDEGPMLDDQQMLEILR